VGCDTVREHDGLAMSSRNVRLDPLSRAQAPQLHRILQKSAAAIRDAVPVAVQLASAREELRQAGFTEIEYIDLRDAKSLLPVAGIEAPARLLAAAWIGGVRLIDNIAV